LLFGLQIPIGMNGEAEAQDKQAVPNTTQFVGGSILDLFASSPKRARKNLPN